MNMSKETRYVFGAILIVVVLGLLFTCGNAAASPGDDGCVGNCDDNGNNPSPVTNTATNNNAVLNANKNVNDIRTTNTNANLNTNTNTNTNANTNLNANVSSNRNTNTISNTSRSVSNATGGVGYGGSSSASSSALGGNGSATASNGSQTTNVSVVESNPGNIKYGGSYTVRSVGVAPDISSYSTAPCRVAIGASGGWIGGAIGFSGSVLDEGCDIWRDHLNLRLAGYASEADLRLCDKPELKKLFGEKCGSSPTAEPSYSSPFEVH